MPRSKKPKLSPADHDQIKSTAVVDKIIQLLDQGKLPWKKPWVGVPYMNVLTGQAYRGRNPIYLSVDVATYDFSVPLFMGGSQARTWGWFPKKGSKACFIKQGMSNPTETEATEGKPVRRAYYAKWVPVFNLDFLQEGEGATRTIAEVKAKYQTTPADQLQQIPAVEAFIKAQAVSTKFLGDSACYEPGSDKITMPPRECFENLIAFYAVWLHEHGHSTGHPARLARDLSGSFGSRSYAFEELIAELCSTLTCERLGIASDLENHAGYLESWLKGLKDDRSYFFSALNLAHQASELLFATAGPGNEMPSAKEATEPADLLTV